MPNRLRGFLFVKAATNAEHQRIVDKRRATVARPSPDLARFEQSAFAGAALLLLALGAYWPVLHGEFLWDDDALLFENPLLQSGRGLWDIWFSTKPTDYFPLTNSAFWLEWRLWQDNSLGYHVTNVLLHGVNAMWLWRVLRQLDVRGAWVAAGIFAVHPVCVASVGWISELKNTLALFFFLASLSFFVRFQTSRTRKDYALALGLFVLAMLGKTSVVILPVILGMVAWYVGRRDARALVIQLAPFFLVALCLGTIGVWYQWHRSLNEFAGSTGTLAQRVAAGGWAVWFYAGKILAPVGLCMIYPRWEPDAGAWWVYLPGLCWLAALAVFWSRRKSWGRPWFFALGCFTIALFPALGFVNLSWFVFSRVSDHLQYLAMPALIALMVSVAAYVTRKMPLMARAASAGMAIAILGVLSWNQASVFASAKRVWEQTLMRNPHCWVANYNLGVVFEAERDFPQAIVHYQAALADNPAHAAARYNLANVFAQSSQFDSAVSEYQELLRRRPEHQLAEGNLGFILLAEGRVDEAIPHFERVLAAHPDDANAHLNLGRALLAKNQLPEARKHFQTAIELRPENQSIVQQMLGAANQP